MKIKIKINSFIKFNNNNNLLMYWTMKNLNKITQIIKNIIRFKCKNNQNINKKLKQVKKINNNPVQIKVLNFY